jgi:hypothetical protein
VKRSFIRLAVLAVLLLGAVPAFADPINLVYNGTFDQLNVSPFGWLLTGGANSQTAYQEYQNPHVILFVSAGQSPWGYASASQVVSGLIPGQTYVVQGDFRYFWTDGNATALSFGVAIGSHLILQADRPSPENAWETFTADFIADGPSVTLSIMAGLNHDASSYQIDNIALYAQPVPEPASLLLVGTGLVGLAGRAWRKRRG